MDQQGHKTGGRRKGRPNNRTLKRNEAAAETVALIGELIPDAFPGDAHAFLVAIYKDPRVDPLDRKDAAKAALPYEKSRPVTVTPANAGAEPRGDAAVSGALRPDTGATRTR